MREAVEAGMQLRTRGQRQLSIASLTVIPVLDPKVPCEEPSVDTTKLRHDIVWARLEEVIPSPPRVPLPGTMSCVRDNQKTTHCCVSPTMRPSSCSPECTLIRELMNWNGRRIWTKQCQLAVSNARNRGTDPEHGLAVLVHHDRLERAVRVHELALECAQETAVFLGQADAGELAVQVVVAYNPTTLPCVGQHGGPSQKYLHLQSKVRIYSLAQTAHCQQQVLMRRRVPKLTPMNTLSISSCLPRRQRVVPPRISFPSQPHRTTISASCANRSYAACESTSTPCGSCGTTTADGE